MAHAHHHHHVPDLDWATMVTYAEREGEVLMPFLEEATARLAELSAGDVARILDVGSGPGVATCVLASRFPSASVIAADGSAEMLANVRDRAARLGLSDRVEIRQIELPEGLADLGQADLVWASMVIHHVGDEAAALRGLRARLAPGGLLALVEFGDPLRILPDDVDLGRPGLWERLDANRANWLADMRASLPGAAESDDYPTMLAAAGFDVLEDRVARVHLDPPLDDRARQVALSHLQRMREHVEPYGDPADLAVLDRLTDEHSPDGILLRPDAQFHASRRLLVCRAT